MSTLAARALEQPQPIRPRLASLFEPLAGPRVNYRETTPKRSGAQRKPSRNTDQRAIPSEPRDVASSVRNRTEDLAPAQSPSKQIDPGRALIKSFSQSVQTPTETRKLDQGRAADRSAVEDSGVVEAAAQSNKRNSDASDSGFRLSGKVVPAIQVKPAIQVEAAIQIAQAIKVEETTVFERVAETTPQSLLPETKLFQPDAPRPSVIVKPEVSADHSQWQRIEPQLTAPEMPPSVHITIGRVDVRAITPAPQLTVSAARQPAVKALSLDEYLKQRNGEQR